MDVLKAQFQRIQQQLAGLNASQKMLVFSLAVIMVMTLLYWGKYAGTAEMEPILSQTLTDDQIGVIANALDAKGIPHTISAGKVLVPADRKREVFATLAFEQMLPKQISGFDSLMKDLNPMRNTSDRDMFFNRSNEVDLSNIIGQFPNVASASVKINPLDKPRIEGGREPSASVIISTRGSGDSTKLARSCAELVSGVVSGLRPEKVVVVINGRSIRQPSEADGGLADTGALFDYKQKFEQVYSDKIKDTFSYIPGLTATVDVAVENKSISEQTRTYDAANTLTKAIETTSHTEETNTAQPAAQEAGTLPNVGANTALSINGGGGSGTSTTITTESEKSMVLPSLSDKSIKTPAGKETVTGATVMVPHSYLVNIYKAATRKTDEPDEAALQPIALAELKKIREGVKKCVNLTDDTRLSVDSYFDSMPALAAVTDQQTATAGLTRGLGGHVKEIAVGVLAVVSLMMVFGLVRKSTPAPLVLPASVAPAGPSMVGGEDVAGEVGSSQAMLDGMELDEDSVRTQQILEQVSTLVKENPDAAANLVKRWMNK